MPPAPNRQLAAIMFTDIVGYTALMGKDETMALRILDKNKSLQYSVIKKHKGVMLKEIGDGLLASFKSVTNAIECASEIQRNLRDDLDLKLRIGIHIGEVVFKNNDVYGDGVNVASRIQSLAEPGQILVSDAVYNNVKNHPDIETNDLGRKQLKNVEEPVGIYHIELLSEGKKSVISAERLQIRKWVRDHAKFLIVFMVFIIAAFLFFYIDHINRKKEEIQWAYQEGIPRIEYLTSNLLDFHHKAGIGPEAWKAYFLTQKVEEIIPDDPKVKKLKDKCSIEVTITSDPLGAKVYAKPYIEPDSTYVLMGTTPITDKRFPSGNINLKIEKPGFEPVVDLVWIQSFFTEVLNRNYTLESIGSIPEDMCMVQSEIDSSLLSWLDLDPFINHPDEFLVDKYEVSNKEYKRFIDSGGYNDPSYWKEPVVKNGDTLNWEKAMSLFVDQTGRPGPSTWLAGDYPEGKDEYPVSGVSWYEAMAYAEFVDKQLPSIYHLNYLAGTWAIQEISKKCNLKSQETWERGTNAPQNLQGVSDLFGNVREWCYNKRNNAYRSIVGGAYNDQEYLANDFYNARLAFDRSNANGFRCIRSLKYKGYESELYQPINRSWRNYDTIEPVDDNEFEIYLRQFNYDRGQLDPEVVYSRKKEHWIREKVKYKVPYSDDYMAAYIFLPNNIDPPYQPIIYWPGAGSAWYDSSEGFLDIGQVDFFVKNGRAVIMPVYAGTFERNDQVPSGCEDWRICYKERLIKMVKDLQKSVDYLETRNDIDVDKLAYYGISFGAAAGPMPITVEDRIKLGIIAYGGLPSYSMPPEVDIINYLPRVKVPVILFNGRYDFKFPLKESIRPFFDRMGTPDKHKKLMLYDDAHFVPKKELIKESLAFLDKYFGEVK